MDDDKPGNKWMLTEADLLPLCFDEGSEVPIIDQPPLLPQSAPMAVSNQRAIREQSASMAVESRNDNEVFIVFI